MALKDILVFSESNADSAGLHEHALSAADGLAQRHQAHLAVSLITTIPGIPMTFAGESYGTLYAELAERAQTQGVASAAALSARLEALPGSGELRTAIVIDSEGPQTLAEHARHSDIVLIGWPADETGRARLTPYVEAILFQSGRPLLLIPEGYKGAAIGTRISAAWNASKEATRAVHDALPLIETAAAVQIVVIDATASQGGHGGDPGADIAAHLARHAANVETKHVPGAGRRIAEILIDEARYFGADLIVMGGYGHSRAREWILGGATRDMMELCPLPILLSH